MSTNITGTKNGLKAFWNKEIRQFFSVGTHLSKHRNILSIYKGITHKNQYINYSYVINLKQKLLLLSKRNYP